MSVLIFAIVTVFNIIVLRYKWNKKHKLDAAFDLTFMLILLSIFGGSFEGTIIAMATGGLLSVYLWICPPKIRFPSPKEWLNEKVWKN
jgi:multisubunit Na+/H+ antiporter MnhB subunit